MTTPDDEDDKLNKSTSSSKKRTRRSSSSAKKTTSLLPSSIVCTPSEAASQPGAVEAGVIVSLLVLILFFVGLYETVTNLPDNNLTPNFGAHMGENLNVALNAFDSVQMGAVASASDVTDTAQLAKGMSTDVKSVVAPPPAADPAAVAAAGGGGEIVIPKAKWPVSLRDEPNNSETILHPGDKKTPMTVPTFWSRPIHNNILMTRETAMKIGSCIVPDSKGSFNRGDACPLHQRTIFIQIASYRDFQCRLTLESAFGRAKYPERLRVAVVDQIVSGEDVRCDEPIVSCDKDPTQALCKYKNQVDVYQMEAGLSVGPVFARHIGYRMYRGEYYATQSDAHVSFTVDWDVDIIQQVEQTHNEMAVLSTYLTDVQGSIDEHGHSKRKTRPIMCNTRWEGGVQGMHLRHGAQPEKLPSIHGEPQLSPWWAAGYSFSRGHFVVNVPYDWLQPMIFQGEEMSIGIRGYTIGYDYYAPERSVCFHHYAVGKNAELRNKVPHFWDNDRTYRGTGKAAMARLLGIVHMTPEVDPTSWDHTDENVYGIGGVRTPEKFYQTFGIDVKKKTTEDKLCKFVDGEYGPMQTKFKPFLRKDGMGIDYSEIKFRWRDPEGLLLGEKEGEDGEEEGEEEGEKEGEEEEADDEEK